MGKYNWVVLSFSLILVGCFTDSEKEDEGLMVDVTAEAVTFIPAEPKFYVAQVLDDEGVVIKTELIGASKRSISMNDFEPGNYVLRTYEIDILDSTVYKLSK